MRKENYSNLYTDTNVNNHIRQDLWSYDLRLRYVTLFPVTLCVAGILVNFWLSVQVFCR